MLKRIKKLLEVRNAKVARMQKITDGAVEETRALNEEEDKEFKELEAEVRALDETIEKVKNTPVTLEPGDGDDNSDGDNKPETVDDMDMREVRALASFVRNTVEMRADTNLTLTDNGAVIPKTIAAKIIKKVYDVCPIYAQATHYAVKGNVEVPYYDEETGTVTVAYATEFTDLESKSGKMASVSLKGFLAGALTKISRSLLNSTDFNLVSFIVNDMGEKIARWIEKELLIGTTSKIEGLSTVKTEVTASSETAIKSDELIDLQDAIPDAYQKNAIWIMNRKTRTAIRKLKDNNGRYLLQDDINSPFGYTILGKPVYCSDNMAEIAAGATTIFYGDMSGLAVHDVENPEIQILRELFATQHAIGVVGWLELDAKIENAQKIAKLTMKASSDDLGTD